MGWRNSILNTLQSKRFWIWQIAGMLIYGIPVVVRIWTGNVELPILSLLATPWIDHYVPGNLVEKFLVGVFFPGGAGAIAGEIFASNYESLVLPPRRKYLARLGGAFVWTSAWSFFQLWGNLQGYIGSYGGNLFEYPMVFPLNFFIASFSIFTADALGFFKNRLKLQKTSEEV